MHALPFSLLKCAYRRLRSHGANSRRVASARAAYTPNLFLPSLFFSSFSRFLALSDSNTQSLVQLCNKCGLFERTHGRPRPDRFFHKCSPDQLPAALHSTGDAAGTHLSSAPPPPPPHSASSLLTCMSSPTTSAQGTPSRNGNAQPSSNVHCDSLTQVHI